ncbi:hypothetical protein EV182_001084 [Spiromyces aspiralis]|uniref:Uncharacterized protein n=1 Tax=Spiromyces aspiralis TaxID=68401 RepID=A0ACC1HGE2_9FUNG|nr:hypothetical protein EV182_001084 [Spiromyces aspiralis]
MQVAVGHPLDTVKVRLQIEGTARFKGPIDCLISTIKNEGVLGLYKGMASPLVGIAAVNSLLFWAYSKLKALQVGSAQGQANAKQIAIAGAGAGAINSILSSPVELLKIRLQAQYGNAHDPAARLFRGPIPLAKHLVREFGAVKGLLWGFWSTVLREVPAYAGFYSGFEFAKRQFLAHQGSNPDGDLGVGKLVLCGSFAGICCWIASYPFDVIKSKVQNGERPPTSIKYITQTARLIKAEHGWSGFLRGFTPTGKSLRELYEG